MHEISKFKVFTLIAVLLFIFVIAAMYTNTKEAADKKVQNSTIQTGEQEQEREENLENAGQQDSQKWIRLARRIDDLEQKINDGESSSSGSSEKLNCSVQGIMDGDNIVPLSAQESLNEGRNSGKEIVMLCKY